MASINTSKATDSFATSETDASGPHCSGLDRQNLHDLHIGFDHGPATELQRLTTSDDTEDSAAHTNKTSEALEIEHSARWRRCLEEWGWETSACFLSLVGFLGTIGLLKAFDGKDHGHMGSHLTLRLLFSRPSQKACCLCRQLRVLASRSGSVMPSARNLCEL